MEIVVEDTNKEPGAASPFCWTCLSSDRKVTLLGPNKEIYKHLMQFQALNQPNDVRSIMFQEAMCICWECAAHLRRVREFHARANKANKMLNKLRTQKTRKLVEFETLSNLTIDERSYTNLQIEDLEPSFNFDTKSLNEFSVKEENYDFCEVKEEKDDYLQIPMYEEDIEDVMKIEVEESQIQDLNIKPKTKQNSENVASNEKPLSQELEKPQTKLESKEPPKKTEPKKTSSKPNKWETLKIDPNKKVFKCDFCSKTVYKKKCIEIHLQTHHLEPPYKCEHCEEYLPSIPLLRQHIQDVHAPKMKLCPYCGKLYKNLIHHIEAIHLEETNGRNHSCQLCGKNFISSRSLKRHVNFVHEGIRNPTVLCPYCKKEYSKGSLDNHIRTHTGERPYKCPKCEKTFKWRTVMVQHVYVKHNIDIREGRGPHHEKPPKPVKKSSAKTDESRKARVCKECRRSFSTLRNYKQHRAVIHDDRPSSHTCDHCEKSFRTSYALKEHIAVHHDKTVELYCEEHNKHYSSRLSLSQHWKKFHAPRDDFVCQYCAKSFYSKTNFERHVRTHTGEKPYKCTHCTSAFSSADGCKSHIDHVHLKIPWPSRFRGLSLSGRKNDSS